MPETSNMERRLTQTETGLGDLGRNVGNLTTDVRSLTAAVQTQGENFDRELRTLSNAVTLAAGPRRTDWATIASIGGLLLAIILAVGAAVLGPVSMRVDAGRAEAMNRFAAMEKAVEVSHVQSLKATEDLDVKLQRETALTSATFQDHLSFNAAEIRKLDERLQREFTLLDSGARERTTTMQKQLDYVGLLGERVAVLETKMGGLCPPRGN